MNEVQVAVYARVSSEQQAEAKTIESQLAEIRTRIAVDGFDLPSILEFVDDGYSGSTLVRPALERLRDVAATGGIDRLYVHCPDRFARNYAYQVLLVEELAQRGVEVIFLNRPLGQTPEDQLLLQVQGVIAEYERARVSRTESTRQATCRTRGASGYPLPCSLRLPLCEQARRWRRSPL
jgi:site-specific DNA recombinase